MKMKMKMMMRIGGILSRNLLRRQRKYHNFGSFFYCTCSFDSTISNPSNFISQVQQPSFVKCPLDGDGDGDSPSSDDEDSPSASSDEESLSSDDDWESSSSDEEPPPLYGKGYRPFDENGSFDKEYSLESILNRPLTYRNYFNGLVAPLAQIFSVSFHTDSDDDRPCDIYGTVYAKNAQGVDLNLYTRPPTNSEVIPNGGVLSLNGGLNNFITYGPTTNTTIDLELNHKSRNTVIIKEKLNLHSCNQDFQDSSNKLIKAIVHGQGCFAVIYYAKFLFAVRAVVKVAIFTKRDATTPYVDVYGNIAMGYGNASQYCNSDDEVRHMKSMLFSRTFDNPERVRLGKTMKLSRYVVAMPAYSSLVIDADISDSHGRLAAGSLDVPFNGPHQKVIDGEFGIIAVTVLFNIPRSEFIPEVGIRELDVRETEFDAQAEDPHVELSSVIDDRKKNLVPSLQQQQMMKLTPSWGTRSFSSMPNNQVVDNEKFYGAVVMELFSVYVGGTNYEVSAVSGSIKIYDSRYWSVFERSLDNPVYFSQEKGFIPIEQHRVIDTEYSCDIYLSFADPLNGNELCSIHSIGLLNETLVNTPPPDVSLDKRLCSYIQGAHGYALLHYIIFESACQAKVEITLFSTLSSSFPARLCGLVAATYNSHTYTTAYEKKYYRSRLFYKPQTEFVDLNSDVVVPLSKSVVAVPEGVDLVVEVDMQVLSPSNQKDMVFGKKVFNINMSRTTHQVILGKCYGVQISTKFCDRFAFVDRF